MDNNNQCTILCLKELGCREDEQDLHSILLGILF